MQAAMSVGLPSAPSNIDAKSGNGVDFKNILKNAVENVNSAQTAAQA